MTKGVAADRLAVFLVLRQIIDYSFSSDAAQSTGDAHLLASSTISSTMLRSAYRSMLPAWST